MRNNVDNLKVFRGMIDKSLFKIDKVSITLLYPSIRVRQNRNNIINSFDNINNNYNLSDHYNNILESTIELYKELGLRNSLDFCNLYTYLLWNGYFSVNRTLKYQEKDRALICSFLPGDIMTGKGACINFSTMLKDLLNKLEYKNATLMCNIKSSVKIEKHPYIKRKFAKEKYSINIPDIIYNKFKSNHVVNLVLDNGRIYIYDPTNITILKHKSKDIATVLSGKGKYKLYPYLSYSLNVKDSATSILDKIIVEDNLHYYNREDYYKSWNYCLDKIKNNEYLLILFYNTISSDTNEIANEVEKIKQLGVN